MRTPRRRLFGRAAIILRLALLRTESENFSAPLPPIRRPIVPTGARVLGGNTALPAPTAMTAAPRIVGRAGRGLSTQKKNQKKSQKKKTTVVRSRVPATRYSTRYYVELALFPLEYRKRSVCLCTDSNSRRGHYVLAPQTTVDNRLKDKERNKDHLNSRLDK